MKKLIPFLLTIILSGCSITDEATFTAEYKKHYEDVYTVEIPEQYELVMVMLAISEVGQTDSSFIEMNTDYHKEVIKHFKPYENHKIIRKINRKVRKPVHTMSYLNAILYRQNVLAYTLNNKDQVVYNNILPKLYAFPFIRNPINKHQKHINDFIRVSGFRKFYTAHKPYYNSLILDYKKNVPLDKMVQWLNQKFPSIAYNNYNVIASPLIKSPNYTRRFYDSTYKQAIMSVGSLKERGKQNIANSHRVVFTEIDHNYVNPVSEKYLERIDEAFKNLDKWRKEGNTTKAYNSPHKTFNEYMTWGLFSLFAKDYYTPETAAEAISSSENTMHYGRNFINFRAFNQKLISLYESNPAISIHALYDKMLNWSISEGTESVANNTKWCPSINSIFCVILTQNRIIYTSKLNGFEFRKP